VTARNFPWEREPLHEAARYGNLGCVMLLCSELQLHKGGGGGGEQWPLDAAERTPLHAAAELCGNTTILRRLLELGCPIYQQDINGCTALHCAALTGDTGMAELLLTWDQQGDRVNLLTTTKSDALGCAARRG